MFLPRILTSSIIALQCVAVTAFAADKYDPSVLATKDITSKNVKPGDWPQWGGWSGKNNTPEGKNIPTEWDIEAGDNIAWQAKLGSQSYGNPVIANGKVYVGTNNGAGHIKRYPESIDLGCLLCFDEKTGEFLWQASSPKLPTGRVHDWPLMGICCSVYAEGDRVWYVTSRGEVACLDANGFRDEKNAGPFQAETFTGKEEADYIWVYDMMSQLNTSQHNMCSCSITGHGDMIFVCTSNGVDESHAVIPSPGAPSFMAMDKNTGKVLWTDNSPGNNIHHGQWSSPTYIEANGRAQVLFGGGDGWLYSFAPEGDGNGKPKLYWKCDCNPKDAVLILGGRGTRNDIIATPVFYDGLVYVAVGQDPEHGEGIGHLWCIDPNKDGNVSANLAIGKDGKEMPYRRVQAVDPAAGEKIEPNPNTAIVWAYDKFDANGNGKVEFEETMHRTIGTVAIKNDLLFLADFSGLFHCIDAKTGKPYWVYDMFAASWGSALIVEDKVYIGDEDGDIAIFELSKEQKQIGEVSMGNAVYSSPVVANDTLFIANKSVLFAIRPKE